MTVVRHTAVYPGSFDPATYGHVDIARRATRLFDRVVVAILENPSKQTLFTATERLTLMEESLAGIENVEICTFQGLLVDLLDHLNADIIVRGLRFVSDFEYEFQMALMNQSLNHKVETVFMVANPERTFVSSSLVKEVARLGRDITPFVPPAVVKALKEKYR